MDAEYYLKTEYALSNRSQCRGCKKKIEIKTLRIAYVIDIDCIDFQLKIYFIYIINKIIENYH
jgi:hypothetical protein